MGSRMLWAAALLGAVLLGCSSGDDGVDPIQLQLEGCAREGIMNLVVTTDEFLRIVDQITRGLQIDGVS